MGWWLVTKRTGPGIKPKPKTPPAKSIGAFPQGKRGTAEVTAARQLLFAEAYVANGGLGTDAAIAVGISPKNAGQWAHRALKNPDVKARIDANRAQLAEKFSLRSEDILRELAKIVYFDPRKLMAPDGTVLPINEWPDDVAGAIASIEVEELFDGRGEKREKIGVLKKIKAWNKGQAIEQAMKHLGLFELDNKQKQGPLEGVSRDVLRLVQTRLEQMNADFTTGRQ